MSLTDFSVPELAFSPLSQDWYRSKVTRYDRDGNEVASDTYGPNENGSLCSSEGVSAALGVSPDQSLRTFDIWTVDAAYNEKGQMTERVRTRPLYDGRTSVERDRYYYDETGNVSVWLHDSAVDDGTVEELSIYAIGAYDSGSRCCLYEFQLMMDDEGYLEYAVCNLGYYEVYKFDRAGRVLWCGVLDQNGRIDGFFVSEFEHVNE